MVAKPNVTVKRGRGAQSDSAKLNGLGAPVEHSQSVQEQLTPVLFAARKVHKKVPSTGDLITKDKSPRV